MNVPDKFDLEFWSDQDMNATVIAAGCSDKLVKVFRPSASMAQGMRVWEFSGPVDDLEKLDVQYFDEGL